MHHSNNDQNKIADIDEVKKFLSEIDFHGYQSLELPYGLKTPGMDRSKSADFVFTYSIKNKSVLDVGCKYGYFCHEALLRGANKVTGIEINNENVKIARKIVELWNRDIEIQCKDFMDINSSEKYDVVLFLNILHHILNPIESIDHLTKITREMMIVEFSTLLDVQTNFSNIQRFLLKTFFKKTSLAYIGSKEYHRIWYFSKKSFMNLYVDQMKLFKKIEFVKSPRKKGRLIAFCWK